MSYLWDDFKNIRAFPANTRVHRDGVFMPELSDEDAGADLPLHIIHIGKIAGRLDWHVDMNEARPVFLTARVETEDAEINIDINANVPGVAFDGLIFCKNVGKLTLKIIGNNGSDNTGIKCAAKLFAAAGSESRLSGLSDIPAGVSGAETDISFSALCDPRVGLLEMSPAQRISSVPAAAGHSASVYRPAPAQIRYLETAGLSLPEATSLLNKAFMEEA